MRKPGKPGDRRESPGIGGVRQVTRKPKGAKPEQQEPKRSPFAKSILGQSGKRRKK